MDIKIDRQFIADCFRDFVNVPSPVSYYEEIKASKEVAKVSIIGKGLLNHYGMAARMFNALYKADVNIRMISTSEIRVTVLVNQEDMVKAMNAAHEEFEM